MGAEEEKGEGTLSQGLFGVILVEIIILDPMLSVTVSPSLSFFGKGLFLCKGHLWVDGLLIYSKYLLPTSELEFKPLETVVDKSIQSLTL